MGLNSNFAKKHWLAIFPLASFAAAIFLLMFLDYFNLENFAFLNQAGFFFDYAWKGRMYLLVFLMLFMFEFVLNRNNLESINQAKAKKRLRILLIIVFALVPVAYIVAINFFGFGQTVLSVGNVLRGSYWSANSVNGAQFLERDWPITIEYIVFSLSSFMFVFAAYGKAGFKAFSISLTFVIGIAVFFFIDTWFPYGTFWPLQLLTQPTAASAAGLLRIMGYHLSYYVMPGFDSTPVLISHMGLPLSVTIEWPCAGVHSLLLYSLIILFFFKDSGISKLRRVVYFAVGAAGAFGANILRVATYFTVMVNQGSVAANYFHDTFGELFSAGWLFLYILAVLIIQRFNLVEKVLDKTRYLHHR